MCELGVFVMKRKKIIFLFCSLADVVPPTMSLVTISHSDSQIRNATDPITTSN